MAKREMKTQKAEVTTEEVVITPEVQEEKPEVIGVVIDCAKLNVRKEAKKDAAILGTIAAKSKVTVVSTKPVNGFYKVHTDTGLDGFCMKNYIKIEQ